MTEFMPGSELQPIVPLERTFDALYGLEMLELSADVARARVEVKEHHMQPMGLVHGGVFASIAESLSSAATAVTALRCSEIPASAMLNGGSVGLSYHEPSERTSSNGAQISHS